MSELHVCGCPVCDLRGDRLDEIEPSVAHLRAQVAELEGAIREHQRVSTREPNIRDDNLYAALTDKENE